MIYSPLYEASDYFQPFPSPESVFGKNAEQYLEFMLPLATVSLDYIDPKWKGAVHFVLPIEPWNGIVGEDTKKHHTFLCRDNWLGFKIGKNHEYGFETDLRFFVMKDLETRDDVNLKRNDKEDLISHYEAIKKSFENNRLHFQEYGALHASYARKRKGKYPDDSRRELVCQLGGHAGWGNWPGIGKFPLSRHKFINEESGEEETSPIPQATDGSDFTFIGWLPAYSYCENYGCNVYLFYHHKHRLALITFDWS